MIINKIITIKASVLCNTKQRNILDAYQTPAVRRIDKSIAFYSVFTVLRQMILSSWRCDFSFWAQGKIHIVNDACTQKPGTLRFLHINQYLKIKTCRECMLFWKPTLPVSKYIPVTVFYM